MANILSIETATSTCSVALHRDTHLLGFHFYQIENSHSSLLPEIIHQLFQNCRFNQKNLDAIAVSSGPGSYTGLRIGIATAKGLSFGLNIPLIAVSSLDAMIEKVSPFVNENCYLCPMIDARRMEVYCKIKIGNKTLWETQPLIVESDTFSKFSDYPIILFGNGAEKTQKILIQKNIRWLPNIHPAAHEVGILALEQYKNQHFVDIEDFTPEYLKPYHTTQPKKKYKM